MLLFQYVPYAKYLLLERIEIFTLYLSSTVSFILLTELLKCLQGNEGQGKYLLARYNELRYVF